MSKPDYTITAKTAADFSYIEEKLKLLPESILCQIENVKMGSVGTECLFKKVYSENVKVILPKDVSQISDFDDYIGCYHEKFFFKHPKYDAKTKMTYLFVDIKVI